ncbi:MAG: hypothetical protein PHE09_10345, partial [Oscillospiraceae bacterium]|nr:hypothetical protein [Oscillospiraceae bacterium]
SEGHYAGHYTYDQIIGFINDSFVDGASFILEKWKETEQWRDVDNELPCDGDLVLAMWKSANPENTELKVLAYSSELGFITADEYSDCDENVTHWKPIKE